jgi:hypothetical protein
MVRLELESPDDLISLASVSETGTGTEALSGVTGLGFPPRDAQYSSGAGNGSKFRHMRFKERNIDIPLYLLGDDREDLEAILKRLALALLQPCILRFVDGAESWVLEDVRMVGGGDYIYGKNTVGDIDLDMVITLRSEKPFWKKEETEGGNLADMEGGLVALTNSGDAPSPPRVTLTGPGMNFTARNEQTGEELSWDGVLYLGEELVIDFDTQTAIDGYGENRYREFSPAPQFFDIDPGENDYIFAWDASSDEFEDAQGLVYYNHVLNPQFATNLSSWTQANATMWTSPTPTITVTRTTTPSMPEGVAKIFINGAGRRTEINHTITGLTPGVDYLAAASVRWDTSKGSKRSAAPYLRINNTYKRPKWNIASGSTHRLALAFTCPDSGEVTIGLGSGVMKAGAQSAFFGRVCVVEAAASAYFTGDTPDTADYTYAWESTANLSKSSRSYDTPGSTDTTNTNIHIGWEPRRQAMV